MVRILIQQNVQQFIFLRSWLLLHLSKRGYLSFDNLDETYPLLELLLENFFIFYSYMYIYIFLDILLRNVVYPFFFKFSFLLQILFIYFEINSFEVFSSQKIEKISFIYLKEKYFTFRKRKKNRKFNKFEKSVHNP